MTCGDSSDIFVDTFVDVLDTDNNNNNYNNSNNNNLLLLLLLLLVWHKRVDSLCNVTERL